MRAKNPLKPKKVSQRGRRKLESWAEQQKPSIFRGGNYWGRKTIIVILFSSLPKDLLGKPSRGDKKLKINSKVFFPLHFFALSHTSKSTSELWLNRLFREVKNQKRENLINLLYGKIPLPSKVSLLVCIISQSTTTNDRKWPRKLIITYSRIAIVTYFSDKVISLSKT